MHRWTEDEFEFLKAHYQLWGRRKVAERLGRSVDAVRKKASQLGLTDPPVPVEPWMLDFIRITYRGHKREELTNYLGVPDTTLKRYAKNANVSRSWMRPDLHEANYEKRRTRKSGLVSDRSTTGRVNRRSTVDVG